MRADPVLVACGHGTRSVAGRRALARLAAGIAALRPGLAVLGASVDVQRPELPEVIGDLVAAGRRAVVVPLLLSRGYHLDTDIHAAAEAGAGRIRAAGPLGPDPGLAEVLADRLRGCGGAGPGEVVVLAAAGSSDPRAREDVEQVARDLARRHGGPVLPGYLSAAAPGSATAPGLAEVITAQVTAGRRVTVASYLLAPGFLADRLAAVATAAGAERVSAPLAPHPLLAAIALSRYDTVVG